MSNATERLADQMGGDIGAAIRANRVPVGRALPAPGEPRGTYFIVADGGRRRFFEHDGDGWWEIGNVEDDGSQPQGAQR
jgi:hypothetical protein